MPYSGGVSNISYAQAIAKFKTCMRTIEEIKDGTISTRMAKVYKQDICYSIQQICEILLKIQFIEAGIKITNYKYFRHDLDDICSYADTIDGFSIYVPTELKASFPRITSWEVHGRYDYGLSVRIDLIEKYLEIIRKWIDKQTKNKNIYNPYRY